MFTTREKFKQAPQVSAGAATEWRRRLLAGESNYAMSDASSDILDLSGAMDAESESDLKFDGLSDDAICDSPLHPEPESTLSSSSLSKRCNVKGGADMNGLMKALFDTQMKNEYIPTTGKVTFDTMRACYPETPDSDRERFAMVEFSQNAKDPMENALEEEGVTCVAVEKGIEWKSKTGVTILGMYMVDDGIEIFQYGRPLSIDTLTSGTRSKREEG